MAFQVPRPSDTPEILWPVPRDPRTEASVLEDTRPLTRRRARDTRSVRLRWGLAWLSLVFGAMTAWWWSGRQEEHRLARAAAAQELRQLAAWRGELGPGQDLRPATLKLYVERAANRQVPLSKQMAGLADEPELQQEWTLEQDALKEARADLEWLTPRLRQLDLIQGTQLTNEIKTNEASLRPVLENLAAQPLCCSGLRFRPGLARTLRKELDRRMREVQLAAATPEAQARPLLPPAPEPRALTAPRPVKLLAKPAAKRTRLVAKAKPRAKTVKLARVPPRPHR